MSILVAENLSKTFVRKRVLDDLSVELMPATIYGLIGPSGAGKSVLLKILAGIYAADAGTITASYSTLSLMFQEGALFDSLSVLDNVAFPIVGGAVPVSNLPKERKIEVVEQVFHILGQVGLADAAHKMPSQISGGMRKRASLARALVTKPDVVFLDDPTSGLDPVSSNVIMKLIADLHNEYRPTMVLVSHDLRRLLPQVDTIIALFNGTVTFQGSLSELQDRSSGKLREFVNCRFDLEGQSIQ